jgi:hypothetical protein
MLPCKLQTLYGVFVFQVGRLMYVFTTLALKHFNYVYNTRYF